MKARQYPAGSILFTCIGSTIGKLGIAPVSLTSNQQINAIFPSEKIDRDFLFYELSLRAPLIRNQAGEQAVPIINKSQFSAVKVALPSPEEQRAISSVLSDADSLIEKLDQFIAKKRDIKKGAMQELLTGKRRLPGFSNKWEDKPVASFSAFVTKGATPTTYGFGWESSGVLFLRSECVSEAGLDLSQSMFISEKAHSVLNRGEVQGGDILMTITGNVGRVVKLPVGFGIANINQHIARIRVNDPNVDAGYVYHWLSQPKVRANFGLITTGQAYPQLSLKQVRESVIPMPSHAEQLALAEMLTAMDDEIAALEAQREKTAALKQGMMQQLLTGKIRLT